MKIPNTVRISGVDYAVTFVSNLNDGEKMLDGCVDYNMSAISLNSDTVGYQRQCIVLWHEILHALIENSCVKLDMEKEEEIVEALSRGIYGVLQDNGGAFFDLVKPSEPTPAGT